MVFSKLACSKRQWKVDVDFPPVGWIGADSTLYRDGKANNVFAVILEPATQLPPAECCWSGLRDLDECTCFGAESPRVVRDFAGCPYNGKNGTFAADPVIRVARQIIARQIQVQDPTEASESDWKHTRT